jgi:hypothetical protein
MPPSQPSERGRGEAGPRVQPSPAVILRVDVSTTRILLREEKRLMKM